MESESPEKRASGTLRSRLAELRAKHAIPALGAGIVRRDGELELDVVGVRVRGGDDPVTLDDRWHIGSCGKSITAALYARLVERGDAQWGARLPDLLGDLASGLDPGRGYRQVLGWAPWRPGGLVRSAGIQHLLGCDGDDRPGAGANGNGGLQRRPSSPPQGHAPMGGFAPFR